MTFGPQVRAVCLPTLSLSLILRVPNFSFSFTVLELTKAKSVLDMTDVSSLTFTKMVYIMGLESTDFAFKQPEVLQLIHAKDKVGKYDLLLAEQFYNEGALFLGHLYQIPMVTLSTFGFSNYMSSLVGVVTPWSYVAYTKKPYTDRMTLMERIDSVFNSLTEELMRTFWYYPAQNAILRKHFAKKFPNLPTIKQLERNISALLLNTYMPLKAPRPISINMIPVGGLHIQPTQPLPRDMQHFLDEAYHGAIYFSLGKSREFE